MISRRLTKTTKAEILEAYSAGADTNFLAEKYCCTTNTINRTVKTLLSASEYKSLKEIRSKIRKEKVKMVDDEISKEESEDSSIELDEKLDSPKLEEISYVVRDNSDEPREKISSENKYNNNKLDKSYKNIDHSFDLIAPLVSGFDFDQEKQKLDFEILNHESLPESVYMIVDKKVELDLQLISDLPEWSFLPEHELKRNAILLFANQRSAKRSCSKNQRVIKIPNTNVFNISKPYLISKGITRLILEDAIISLDN